MRIKLTKEGKAELYHIFYMQALTYDQGIIEHGNRGEIELDRVEKRLRSNGYKQYAKKQVHDIETGEAVYGGRTHEEIWAAMVENSLTPKRIYRLQLFGWGIRVW